MKNQIRNSIVTLSIIATTMLPMRSQAAIGSWGANPAVMVLGAAIGITTVIGGVQMYLDSDTVLGKLSGLLIAGAGGYVGLIILDGETDASLNELRPQEAKDLKISDREALIFNSELEEANSILKTITSESINEDLNTKEIHNRWLEYSQYLSKETFTVIKAIALQNSN